VLGISSLGHAGEDDTRVALLGPDGVPVSERQRSKDIIVSVRKRMEAAHERWNHGISKFNQYVGIFNQDEFGPVFKHIVDLFNGTLPGDEPVKALQQLFAEHPHELEFYIPQITIFLLYGSFQNSEILKEFIFDLCSYSPSMAHKIRWFVISFCLSGAGIGSCGVSTLNHFLLSIEQCGVTSARQLFLSALSPSEMQGGGGEAKGDRDSSSVNETMISVPLSFRVSVESGVDGGVFRAPDQQRTEQTYPMHRTLEVIHQPPGGLNFIDAFSPTFSFWDELVQISRDLCPLARELRTPTLKSKLSVFKHTYLPSASIFAPVGRTQHRVWNIVDDECFAFSTRERAPIFVCLEVVDYATRIVRDEGGGKKWEIPNLGFKKWFGDSQSGASSPVRGNSSDYSVSDAKGRAASESTGNATTPLRSGKKPSAKQATPTQSSKPILGDRVLSAPLLSDLLRVHADDDEYGDESVPGPGSPIAGNWEQATDIEAQSEELGESSRGGSGGLSRGVASPPPSSHDSEHLQSPQPSSVLDEVGQWALPSIPKTRLEKHGGEPVKKGFKQGITK
jgi:hypothetical protein